MGPIPTYLTRGSRDLGRGFVNGWTVQRLPGLGWHRLHPPGRELLDLARLRRVDLIVVWRLGRAFRSVLDGATTLQQLRGWGCGLRSLQEPWIDTTTPIGEAMFHITIAWAALERQTLSERTKAGMDRARAEGKRIGRPKGRPIEEHRRWPEVRDLVVAGTLSRAEGARRLKVRYDSFVAALNASTASEKGVIPAEFAQTA